MRASGSCLNPYFSCTKRLASARAISNCSFRGCLDNGPVSSARRQRLCPKTGHSHAPHTLGRARCPTEALGVQANGALRWPQGLRWSGRSHRRAMAHSKRAVHRAEPHPSSSKAEAFSAQQLGRGRRVRSLRGRHRWGGHMAGARSVGRSTLHPTRGRGQASELRGDWGGHTTWKSPAEVGLWSGRKPGVPVFPEDRGRTRLLTRATILEPRSSEVHSAPPPRDSEDKCSEKGRSRKERRS